MRGRDQPAQLLVTVIGIEIDHQRMLPPERLHGGDQLADPRAGNIFLAQRIQLRARRHHILHQDFGMRLDLLAHAADRPLAEQVGSGDQPDQRMGEIFDKQQADAAAHHQLVSVVQIGVPMQTREPYGKPQFWPLWDAAAAAGLPVAVHLETGNGIGLPPTPSGQPRTYEQYLGFSALTYLYHLMNMIAEGVFERTPGLRVVWADGAADMLTPLIWRMDTFGRPHLEQTPWAPRMPSDYLPGHIYFVQGSLDGPGDVDFAGEWLGFTGKDNMVMFGSSYPHWQLNELKVPTSYSGEQRDKLCWRNAAELYGIDVGAGVSAQ